MKRKLCPLPNTLEPYTSVYCIYVRYLRIIITKSILPKVFYVTHITSDENIKSVFKSIRRNIPDIM